MPTTDFTTPPQKEPHSLGGFLRWSAVTLFCGAVLLGTARRAAAATTITVSSTADTAAAGTLRSAITQANLDPAGDVIDFNLPPGSVITLSSSLPKITNTMSITGPGASNLTIDGKGYYGIFNLNPVAARNVNISGLTLSRGYQYDSGGAIVNGSNSNLTLDRVRIQNSSAYKYVGGGIFNSGTLTVKNSTIDNCRANGRYGYGGGIYSSSTLTLQNCTISGCRTSHFGGGIYIGNYATALIQDSTVTNCTATTIGGGIMVASGNTTIQNSTIAYNYNSNLSPGAGIYMARQNACTVTLQSTILSGNYFSGVKSDIYRRVNPAPYGTLNVSNSLIKYALPGTINGANSANIFNKYAQLGNLQYNGGPTQTMRPKAGSPVLGVGSNPAGLPTDQRGAPRTVAGKVDIGAVEVQPAQSLIVTNANDSGPGSLRAAATFPFDAPSTVTFDPVYFSTPRTIKLTTGEIAVGGPVTITGPGAANCTVDAGSASRIFHVNASYTTPITISGLTLTRGAGYVGGGVYLSSYSGKKFGGGANLTLSGVVISSCTAKYGGGIASRGQLTLNSCVVQQSKAVSGNLGSGAAIGGGIIIDFASVLTIQNSNISGNSVSVTSTGNAYGFGGGIGAQGITKIQNSTISANTVTVIGAGNSVALGGGVYDIPGKSCSIQNSTISGNTVSASGAAVTCLGGGLYVANFAVTTVQNSTIAYNWAKSPTGSGGGIYIGSGNPNTTLVSTIVAKNTHNAAAPVADDVTGSVKATSSNNLIGDGTGLLGISSGIAGNQIGSAPAPIDPLLRPLKLVGGIGPVHILKSGSPAIDMGLNTVDIFNSPAVLGTDQRGTGFPRLLGPAVDIGATEFELIVPTATLTSAPNVTGSSNPTLYTFKITFADNVAIDLLSLGNSNILVTGPNGFSQLATFVSATPNIDGPLIVATYTITPPGGGWDATDDGLYTVAMQPNQVLDTSANAVPALNLGTFQVLVASFACAPTATPNPTIVGLDVQFFAQALGNQPINYLWNFGDGTQANGANPTHAFSAIGTYTVLLTIVDATGATSTATITVVVIDPNGDSDGDGFSNGVEASLTSDPNNPASTPFNLPPPKAGGKIDARNIKIQLAFGAPKSDKLFVSGYLPVPPGFLTAGQYVIADIGNVVRGFLLDQSGTARTSTAPNSSVNDIFRLKISKSGTRKFQLTIGATSMQQIFANEPSPDQVLTNNPKAGTFAKKVRVAIYFNGFKYESIIGGKFRVTRHGVNGVFTK